MAEAVTKLPSRPKRLQFRTSMRPQIGKPFEALRNQVDRLLHDFQTGFLQAPSYRSILDMELFWRRDFSSNVTPAIDIVEKRQDLRSDGRTAGPRCRTSNSSFPTMY